MDRIGEYLIRRLVGEGGMGKVYEAEERLSKRRVALKVLRAELARSEEGRRLFMNEMTILAHLDHPNVVRSLACSEVEGQLVMTLEFLDGQTLRALLTERGRLGHGEAIGIVVQVAAALGAAHRQSPPIVHRDLKPENIMITSDGVVKVMDFGIAKVLQALSKTTTQSVGTLQYMSPEQIDAAAIDARSDLYCLGLILYEMLSGRPPFESASPRELLNMQCTLAPPSLPEEVRRELPRGVERLLLELLEKAADDRPQSAEDVLHELEPFAPASIGAARPRQRPGGPAQPDSGSDRAEAASQDADQQSAAKSREPERKPRAEKSAAVRAGGGHDTIALVERAVAPREVAPRIALMVVLALSALAGLVTYLVRSQGGPDDGPRRESPSATADRADEDDR